MKTAQGVVQTRFQTAFVEFQCEDFTTPEMLAAHAAYFADLDEAERRGGEFFTTMGDLARQRIEGTGK